MSPRAKVAVSMHIREITGGEAHIARAEPCRVVLRAVHVPGEHERPDKAPPARALTRLLRVVTTGHCE